MKVLTDNNLTVLWNRLKKGILNNRNYEPTEFSGKGYKVLEKNIQTINGVKKNILTAIMLSEANTIYEIRYDFDLNGEIIEMQEGCTLKFCGGSLKNGTIKGKRGYIINDLNGYIFNNCTFIDFSIPHLDIRWIGGKSDYNETTQVGTDNADVFAKAIDLIGKYYNGLSIMIIGQYYIGKNISFLYDLNLQGKHNNSRDLLGAGSSDNTSPSMLILGKDACFTMNGRSGSGTATFCNFSIHNIKVLGLSKPTFIKYYAAGSPSRVSIMEECEFVSLGYCLYLYTNSNDTMLGNLTISKCVGYYNDKFIYATSDSTNYRTLCNFAIRDSNIEQGGKNAIFIKNAFSSIIIDNNNIEGQAEPIRIEDIAGDVTISNNYMEANTGTVIYATSRNIKYSFVFSNNFINEKIKVLLSGFRIYGRLNELTADSSIYNCWIEDFDNFQIGWIPVFDYGTSVMFSKFNRGNGDTFCHSDISEGLLGTVLDNSFTSRNVKDLKDSEVGICAFYANGTGSIGFYHSGSGRQGGFSCDGGLVIFKQKLYGKGVNNILMKSANNAFISGLCFIDDNTKLKDILIPVENTLLIGNEKPTFENIKAGYAYFDTSLSPARMVWYKGDNKWIDATGTEV